MLLLLLVMAHTSSSASRAELPPGERSAPCGESVAAGDLLCFDERVLCAFCLFDMGCT